MVSEENKTTAQNIMLSTGLLLMVVCAILPLLNVQWEGTRWCYAFGATLALAERMTERYKGNNLRIRRLYVLGKISALLYCVSAYTLFFPITGSNGADWLPFLLAGAIMQLYASLVYDHEIKKENQQ